MECDDCKLKDRCTGMPCLCNQISWQGVAWCLGGSLVITGLLVMGYFQL
jgi:hypothetical protein